jgi:predicted  nucleic acid-binding Zn-ribbon protein
MAGLRRKTMRKLSPTTRKVARLQGEVASISRRLKNLIPAIQELEFESQALRNSQKVQPDEIKQTADRLWKGY